MLKGKTALVTGSTSGIGLGVALSLARQGASVVLNGFGEFEGAKSQVAAFGVKAGYHGADMSKPAEIEAMMAYADQQFGGVDILVNNAGTNPAYGPLVEQDHGRFAKTFDVNLWAPLMWTQACWDAWMRDNGGAIVNVASLGGLIVGENLGVYHASKAALIHLTRQLALELGPKVRVNAVAPGVVRTRLSEALWREQEDAVAAETPLGRIGEPKDVGSAIAFLAGEESSWISGETMVIDGGQILTVPQP
jgi:NAD(P)-dependent dehydrogenase (short-subunit alcohol dehydrogenase family)